MTYSLLLIVAIAGVLFGTRALGALFVRFGMPAVVGEILAGVVLGGSVLGLLDTRDPIIHALAQAGAMILLFAAGLHTEPSALWRAGRGATGVAVVGVVVPFMLGYFTASWLGANWLEAAITGAALSATSVGVSERVLRDLGRLESEAGRTVLGAAVLDDVIGLAILAVLMSLVTGHTMTMESLIWSAVLPASFLLGLMLDSAGLNGRVERATAWLTTLLVPFFFAVTGALVNLRMLGTSRALTLAALLVAVGVVGKVVAGWAATNAPGDKLLIGMAMVPRGEIGLIFAQAGLAAGAIDQVTFAAIMLMVLVTTLITPPALVAIARRTTPVVAT